MIENPHDLHTIAIALRAALDQAATDAQLRGAAARFEATLAKVDRLRERWRRLARRRPRRRAEQLPLPAVFRVEPSEKFGGTSEN